jgi:hypothetical protein
MATIDRERANDNILGSKLWKRAGLARLRRDRLARPRGLADLRVHGVDRGERRPPIAFCSSGSSISPIGGMTAMYLLMSFFHLSPWLELASGRPRARG